MRRVAWILALAAAGTLAGTARAAPQEIVGGETDLMFTVDLDALDVAVSARGSAAIASPGVILPITSGVVDLVATQGSIQHQGSGLEFDFGGVSVDADNLEFDFDDRTVNGDLSAGPLHQHTGIFDIVECSHGGCVAPGGSVPTMGYGLFLRPQAADFFENGVFGDKAFDDGDQILFAKTYPNFAGGSVPEPWRATLVGVSLAALVSLRVSRKHASSQGA